MIYWFSNNKQSKQNKKPMHPVNGGKRGGLVTRQVRQGAGMGHYDNDWMCHQDETRQVRQGAGMVTMMVTGCVLTDRQACRGGVS